MSKEFSFGGRKHPDPSKQARRAGFRAQREATKQAQAEERNAYWASLSPAAQLAELDRRGEPAVKQRKRLLALIAQS